MWPTALIWFQLHKAIGWNRFQTVWKAGQRVAFGVCADTNTTGLKPLLHFPVSEMLFRSLVPDLRRSNSFFSMLFVLNSIHMLSQRASQLINQQPRHRAVPNQYVLERSKLISSKLQQNITRQLKRLLKQSSSSKYSAVLIYFFAFCMPRKAWAPSQECIIRLLISHSETKTILEKSLKPMWQKQDWSTLLTLWLRKVWPRLHVRNYR